MKSRIVREEEGWWCIRTDDGELDAAEQEVLKQYLGEVGIPFLIRDGRIRIPGTVLWEPVFEILEVFYDGRAEVYPF